jgi:hypothetical protein
LLPIITFSFATVIFLQALHPASNLEEQVPVFMSPSDWMAQLYPQGFHRGIPTSPRGSPCARIW